MRVYTCRPPDSSPQKANRPLTLRFFVTGARPTQHVSTQADQMHLRRTFAYAETACTVASKLRLEFHELVYQHGKVTQATGSAEANAQKGADIGRATW